MQEQSDDHDDCPLPGASAMDEQDEDEVSPSQSADMQSWQLPKVDLLVQTIQFVSKYSLTFF